MNLQEQIKRIQEMMSLDEIKKIPKPSKNFLYHGTHIRNLDSIQKFGLIPDIGETIRSTQSYQDYEEYANSDYKINGILFFSENPDTWSYSHYGQSEKDINEAVLVIVRKNDTIFRKTNEGFGKEGKIVNIYNEPVKSVNRIPVDNLPLFIERGDYFSFEEQEPYDILYGERLIEYLKKF